MDDLISRQAASTAIDMIPYRAGMTWYEFYQKVLQTLCDLPSIDVPYWIPCSERLPVERTNPNTLDFEQVLCSTTFGDVRAYKFGKPMGHSEPHFWHGAGLVDEYVVAWMPLPEPYREDDDGKMD